MGCSMKAASEFYEDRDNLIERVKGIKLFDDMIEEYAQLQKEHEELWDLIKIDEYGSTGIFNKIRDLWDNYDDIGCSNGTTLEEKTIALLQERRKGQIKLKFLTKKMKEISVKFSEAVGNTGKAGIEDLI